LFESQPHRPRSALLKLDQRKADVSGMAGNHTDACVHHIIAGCVSFQVFAAVAVHLEHRQSATGGPERLRRWDSLAISGRNYGNRRTEPNAVRVVGQSCGSTPLHDRQSFGELILVAGSDVCVAKDNAHQSSRVASRYANAGGDADAGLTYIHCALAGQEVRSALNPSVFAVDALVRSLSSQRFADSRGVFQQNMTLTHQREKQKSQPVVGHHLDRTDVLPNEANVSWKESWDKNPDSANLALCTNLGYSVLYRSSLIYCAARVSSNVVCSKPVYTLSTRHTISPLELM